MGSTEREMNDRQILLNTFPEEVWLEIFDKISSKEDQVSFNNSSLFLRNMVLPQRTQFMFENVFKILGKHYEKNMLTPGSVYCYVSTPPPPDIDSQTLKRYLKTLFLMLIYQIRMVCTSWSNAVLVFYQNHPLHYRLQPRNFYCIPIELVAQCTKFMIQERFVAETPEDADLFLSHFSDSHGDGNRNPFFGKSVRVEFKNWTAEHHSEFTNKMFCILLTYGHHIWYFDVGFAGILSNAADIYSKIRTMLVLMPNLKVLRLYFDPDQTWDISTTWKSEMKLLQDEILARPLPEMRDLRMLSACNVPTPFFEEVLRNCAQLRTLYIFRGRDQEDNDIYTVPLPNLDELDINFYTKSGFEKLINPKMKWPLTKLDVGFGSSQFIEWQHIFTMLETMWADSLTYLAITLPVAMELADKKRIFQEGAALRLNLPRLKILHMIIVNLTCLDFLLSLKESLTELNITIGIIGKANSEFVDPGKVERGKIIKLLSCASRPFKSNIWTLFPYLERAYLHQEMNVWKSSLVSSDLSKIVEWSRSRREWESEMNVMEGDSKSKCCIS